MKLIVGLGNPGAKYETTRHNVGFLVIDHLSDRFSIPVEKQKWQSFIGEGWVEGEKIVLCKPQTFMNLSGHAVRQMMNWFKSDIEDLLVVYDDIDLPLGQIRLRLKGSAGGHNGMKSVQEQIGTAQFKRLRIGVGRPEQGQSVIDYVLMPFPHEDVEKVTAVLDNTADAVQCWVQSTFLEAMNRYNRRN